jgi:hypothetical protein
MSKLDILKLAVMAGLVVIVTACGAEPVSPTETSPAPETATYTITPTLTPTNTETLTPVPTEAPVTLERLQFFSGKFSRFFGSSGKIWGIMSFCA